MNRCPRAVSALLRPMLAACALALAASTAQGSAVIPEAVPPVSRGDTTTIMADAGGRVTIVFTVMNHENVARKLEGSPLLPSDWRVVSGAGVTEVPAGTSRPIFLQALVPTRTAPGTHELRLEIRAAGERRVREVLTRRVRVRERRDLEVVAIGAPHLALAGTDYEASFLVRNRGNVSMRIRLDVSEHAGFARAATWREESLEAGAAREVGVVVHTKTGRSTVLRHIVELRATAVDRGDTDTTATAFASTAVLVVPASTDRASRFHQLPMQARFGFTPTTQTVGTRTLVVGELSGGGPIADGNPVRADFRLRGSQGGLPGQQGGDEYAFSLTHSRFKLQLGDQVYSLSPLTEPGREASGASVSGEAGGFSIRGLAARNRRFNDGMTVLGAGIGYGSTKVGRLTANYLERGGWDSSRIVSVRAQFHPVPLVSLDVETAQGVGTTARAVSATMSGWHPRASYALQHLDVARDFAGPWRGTQTDAVSLALRIAGPFRVHGSASQQQSSRSLGSLRQTGAAITRTGEAGVGLGERLDIAFVRSRALRDSASAPTVPGNAHEALVRMRMRGSLGPANVLATVIAGDVQRDASGDSTRTYDVNVQAGIRFAHNGSLTGSVQHVRGARLHSLVWHEASTASVRARMFPFQRLGLDISVAGSRQMAPRPHDFLSLEGSLSYHAPRGHVVSLSARAQGGGAAAQLGEPTVHISYAIPLGIPIGYSRTGSRLEGRIYDSETGKGIRNAMVLVGEQVAVSDAQGRLTMSGLPAGEQYVQLDLGQSAVDRVALTPPPPQLTMRPDHTARVDVAVVRGATVSGQVIRLAPSSIAMWDGSRAALTKEAGLPGVLVTLVREGENRRLLTDHDGSFKATGLRPGRWVVTVDAGEAPEQHYVAMPSTTVEVAPGQSATASFEVLPRKRVLVMIDEARVVADAAPGNAVRPATAPPKAVPAVAVAVAPAVVPARAPAAPTPAPTVAPAAPTPDPLPPTRSPGFHVVSATDRTLENLAIWIYGDATLWPKLWLANRATLRSPTALRAGMLLVVPPRAPLTAAEIRARDELQKRSAGAVTLPADR